jgi:hypothetical protein
MSVIDRPRVCTLLDLRPSYRARNLFSVVAHVAQCCFSSGYVGVQNVQRVLILIISACGAVVVVCPLGLESITRSIHYATVERTQQLRLPLEIALNPSLDGDLCQNLRLPSAIIMASEYCLQVDEWCESNNHVRIDSTRHIFTRKLLMSSWIIPFSQSHKYLTSIIICFPYYPLIMATCLMSGLTAQTTSTIRRASMPPRGIINQAIFSEKTQTKP